MTDDGHRRQRGLDRLVQRQDGVISLAQAAEMGIDRAAVRRRVAAGRWRRVGPRVYRVADHGETPRSRVIAAMLSLGGDATLVGRSAAWWWRLHMSLPARVEVAVGPDRRPRERLEVELSHRTIDTSDRVMIDGIVVTKKPLTVLDAAVRLGLVEGARLMDDALLRSAVTVDALREAHMRCSGRPGSEIVRELLVLAAGGARSHAERMAHRELRAAGISGWAANVAMTVPNFGRVVADIVFTALRVVVEIDGWAFHRDQAAFRRDAARQNALVAARWTVIRTNWYQLMEEPEIFVAALRAALAAKI